MRGIRGTAAAVIIALAMAGLSGCTLFESQSCPSWVGFDTPAAAAKDAAAVVAGRVTERSGTATVFGSEAHVWTVEVDRWLKGSGGDSIQVTSVPWTCGSSPAYPDGDPFERAAADGPSIVFLFREGGSWRGITPSQAIVQAAPGGGIPDAWPPGSEGSPMPQSPAPQSGSPAPQSGSPAPQSPTPVESRGVD